MKSSSLNSRSGNGHGCRHAQVEIILRSGIIFSYEHPSKLAFRSDFARLIKLNKNVTLLILMLAAKHSIMY